MVKNYKASTLKKSLVNKANIEKGFNPLVYIGNFEVHFLMCSGCTGTGQVSLPKIVNPYEHKKPKYPPYNPSPNDNWDKWNKKLGYPNIGGYTKSSSNLINSSKVIGASKNNYTCSFNVEKNIGYRHDSSKRLAEASLKLSKDAKNKASQEMAQKLLNIIHGYDPDDDISIQCNACKGTGIRVDPNPNVYCQICESKGNFKKLSNTSYSLDFPCGAKTGINIVIDEPGYVAIGGFEYTPCNFLNDVFISALWKYAKDNKTLPKLTRKTFPEVISLRHSGADKKLVEILKQTIFKEENMGNDAFWDDLAAQFDPLYNSIKKYSNLEI